MEKDRFYTDAVTPGIRALCPVSCKIRPMPKWGKFYAVERRGERDAGVKVEDGDVIPWIEQTIMWPGLELNFEREIVL